MIRRLAPSILLCAALCGSVTSCIGRDPPSITSNDPGRLIPAIEIGVKAHDRHIIPYLISDLESDDSAVRMYSIDGLRRMTGEDFGYIYYQDTDERKPALDRWKLYLAEFNP
ncbi:MAG: hypothetical protein ABSH22_07605 [Tepidisphaeraceae bacterium]|jgi:hypothetical protein